MCEVERGARDLLRLGLVLCLAWIQFAHSYVLDNGIVIGKNVPEKMITCWTCPNKTNNDECNDWAPDLFCPQNHTVCKTVHSIHTTSGQSVLVNKQCVQEVDCTKEMIGCHSSPANGVMDCVSCCNTAYCNEQVPTNHSTAILLSSLESSGSVQVVSSWKRTLLMTLCSFMCTQLYYSTRTTQWLVSAPTL